MIKTAKSTEKALTVVLIGCGRVAEKHLRALRFAEKKGLLKLAGAVDACPEAAQKLLQTTAGGYYKDRPVFSGAEDFFAAHAADIAAITTPSGSHKKLALEALAAGCHLLVEKPLAMHREEAEEIVRAAETAGKRVALGHIYRYFPIVEDLARDLRKGRFGRILYGSVDVRWGHDQAYYDSAPWRGSREADGGVVMNQSVHALDLMAWLLNAGELLEVRAFCATQAHRMESEDLGLGSFHFRDDKYLNLEASSSGDQGAQEASFYICCEKGEIRARYYRKKPKLSVKMHGGKEEGGRYLRAWLLKQLKMNGPAFLKEIGNPHTAIYLDLLQAIRDERAPLADAVAGARSVGLVEAFYEAAGICGQARGTAAVNEKK